MIIIPQSEKEFVKVTIMLESSWYTNDDYNNFYIEWTKIITEWDKYIITNI